MKKIIIYSLLALILQNVGAQKIDTIYYDSNWKGVPVKAFATYMTIVLMSNDSKYENMGRGYHLSGELQAEYTPIYIDKFDASKSQFKGQFTTYYKSGKKENVCFYNELSKLEGIYTVFFESGTIKQTANYKNGLAEGEVNSYFENGKISEASVYSNNIMQSIVVYDEKENLKTKCELINGKMDGIYYEYLDDGSGRHIELEISDEKPKNDFITVVDTKGNRIKYDRLTNQVIKKTPSPADRKSSISNGITFQYYEMNGIFLAVNVTISNDLGKYFMGSIAIGNNAIQPILFEGDKISAFVDKDDKKIECKVYTSDEYSKLVGKKLSSRSFWNAFGESLATMNAGVSTSSTNSISAGYVNSAAIGADNNGNVAVGVGTSYGANATSSQTQNYNGGAQYQADQNANKNIAQYNNQLDQYKNAVDEGYLKSNNIESGQTITGNVNIKYQKGKKLTLYLTIDSMIYPFEWEIVE